MTQTPGWYPEPDPTYSGPPGRLRYWDGQRWTEHVHEPSAAPQYSQPQYAQPAATPDGEPLARWWSRALAALLDFLISIPLYAIAAAPVVASQWDEISTWFSDQMDAAEAGTSSSTPLPDVFDPTTGAGVALVLLTLLVSVIYSAVFLRWKQATPGKMIVGLRVRLRDLPGLPTSAILLRVGFVAAIGVLRDVPILGVLAVLLGILDYLWAAWDSKKQTLHDKVARTNVVKVR